jgi:hypothetical protein
MLRELELKMPSPYYLDVTAKDIGRLILPPTIRRLEIRGMLVLDGLVAAIPRLRRLAIEAAGRLAHPTLEWLEVGSVDVLPACRPENLPRVTHLTMRYSPTLAGLDAAWLAKVTELDLFTPGLTESIVEWLITELAGRRLKHIDVTGSRLPPRCRDRLSTVCEKLTFPDQ